MLLQIKQTCYTNKYVWKSLAYGAKNDRHDRWFPIQSWQWIPPVRKFVSTKQFYTCIFFHGVRNDEHFWGASKRVHPGMIFLWLCVSLLVSKNKTKASRVMKDKKHLKSQQSVQHTHTVHAGISIPLQSETTPRRGKYTHHTTVYAYCTGRGSHCGNTK